MAKSTQTLPRAGSDCTSETHLLWPLQAVLRNTSISRSGWLAGVKDGRYPPPIRLSARRVAWRSADILQLIATLESSKGQQDQCIPDDSQDRFIPTRDHL